MKKMYLLIISITTIISITAMLNLGSYEKVGNKIDVAYNENVINYDEKNQIVNVDDIDIKEENDKLNKKNEDYKSNDSNSNERKDDCKKRHIENKSRELMDEFLNSDYEVTNEELNIEFDSYNKRENELNKHVIKKTPDEIVSDLSLKEKAKLIGYFSKVPKSEYDDLEEYLTYTNQRAGVGRIMKILEKYLSNDEMDDTKEIMSEYVDIKRVEDY